MNKLRFVAILSLLGFITATQAQNTGPVAPEAVSFEPVDANNMVNMVTGDFSYVIPLLHVPGPGGGYPLALSYHGGVAMDQEASWVGLGWNINPGAINRSVNGFPDDWYDKKNDTEIYASGDNLSAFTIGVGVSIGKGLSLGGNITFGDYWGWGVETDIGGRFGKLGANYSSESGLGFNVSSYLNKSLRVDYSFDLKGNLGFGLNHTAYYGLNKTWNSGVGIFLSSGNVYGSVQSGYIGSSFPLSNKFNSSDQQMLYNTKSIAIPLARIYIRFSDRKIKYWLYRNSLDECFGMLYADDAICEMKSFDDNGKTIKIDDSHCFYNGVQSKSEKMDSYLIPYDKDSNEDIDSNSDKNSLLYAAYDSYSVAAQGLMGDISPRLYKDKLLTHDSYYLNSSKTKELVWHYSGTMFTNDIEINPQFYMLNDNSGFISMNTGKFTGGQELSSIVYNNNDLNKDYFYNGKLNNGYFNNRKVGGNYVQWFTNKQINDGSARLAGLIVDSVFFSSRGDYKCFDQSGIGAFTVTALDGKKYHYSLPVYEQLEILRKNGEKTGDFLEYRKLNKYAYTWLLTAITGPDYYDKNEDGFANDGDFGYWVSFNYGKLTDGYMWQIPYDLEGKTYATFDEEISWGVKQIFYLNSIQTQSHIAYFIKKKREDGVSQIINYSKENYLIRSIQDGHVTSKWYANLNYQVSNKIEPLLLERILLVKKTENSKVQVVNTNIINNDVLLSKTEQCFSYPAFGTPPIVKVLDISVNSKVSHNLYTSSNISNIETINQSTIKEILFTYNYELCENTPNSFASNKGKLTLKSLSFRGLNSKKQIPDYFFYYNKLGLNSFNENQKDLWGYDKDNPENWSLKEIVLPTGAKITVNYEKNTFKSEAVYGNKMPIIESWFNGNDFTIKVAADNNAFKTNNYYKIKGTVYRESSYEEQDPTNPYESILKWQEYDNIPVAGSVLLKSKFTTALGTYLTFELPDYFPVDASNVESRQIRDGFLEDFPNDFTQYGGGVRVKNITLTDELNNSYKTEYNYCKPNTNYTSGTICYSPYELEKKYVPYITELPVPKVVYSYVTVGQSGSPFSVQYEFESYQNADANTSDIEFGMGKQFKVINHQSPTEVATISGNHYGKAYGRSSTIVNNFNMVGRLKSVKTVSSIGQTLNSQLYEYYDTSEMKIGYEKETYNYYKRYASTTNNWVNTTNVYNVNATSKSTYPSIVKSVNYKSDGFERTVYNDLFDFYTGNVVKIRTKDIDNKEYVTELIPAYKVYNDMGPKSLNPANKNMLSQEAASLTYIFDERNQNYKPVGVSIQTWSNNWVERDFDNNIGGYLDLVLPNVWRKHKTFIWKGDLVYNPLSDVSGYYGSDFDNYNTSEKLINRWFEFSGDGTYGWLKSSEVTRYNRYSAPLEMKDINGNYASSLVNIDQTQINSSASNASFSEYTACGFEEEKLSGNVKFYGGNLKSSASRHTQILSNDAPQSLVGTRIDGVNAHTGNYLLKINSRIPNAGYAGGPTVNIERKSSQFNKIFVASVWVNCLSSADVYLGYNYTENISGTSSRKSLSVRMDATNSKQFGSWKLFRVVLTMPADIYNGATLVNTYGNFEFWVDCIAPTGGFAYIDDFRIQPANASVNSYVYDPFTNAVNYILNNDNIATMYEYDDVGRLKATYKETANGFKKVSEHNQGFARPMDTTF